MQVNKHTTVAFPNEVPTDSNLAYVSDDQRSSGALANDVAHEASGLVEQMIANSLHRLTKSPVVSVKIDWPTGAEITPQKGVDAIEACIQVYMTTPT